MNNLKRIIAFSLCFASIISANAGKKNTPNNDTLLFGAGNTVVNPMFLGHRGLQPFGPENSIPAFTSAGEHRMWGIETDFRITKDNVVVCIHDKTLDRTTTGTGEVSAYTFDELKAFSIKEINAKTTVKRYDYKSFSRKDLRIPTIDEYLSLCRKYGCVAFIELKEDNRISDIMDIMTVKLKEYGMEGRCVISSSKMEYLQMYRKKGNEFIHKIFGTIDDVDTMVKLGNAGIAFNVKTLSKPIDMTYHGKQITSAADLVNLMHRLGLKTCFRAVDTVTKADYSLNIGIDYMPTNNMWTLGFEDMAYKGKRIDISEPKYILNQFMIKSGNKAAWQGMAISSGLIFAAENSGRCCVFDMATRKSSPIATFMFGSAEPDNHSNMLNFGTETKPGASFPLLYVTVGKPNVPIEWTCMVESITRNGKNFTSELVQTITLDQSSFKAKGLQEMFGCPAWLVDRERGFLWVLSARIRTLKKTCPDPSANNYILTKFRIPKLEEGEKIVFTVDDVLAQVIFPFDAYITQGGCMRDGKVYYSFGFKYSKHPDTPSQIRVFDTDSGTISSSIDLTAIIPEEMEDLAIYDGRLYANTNSPKIYVFDF